jgi:hypothetical protein
MNTMNMCKNCSPRANLSKHYDYVFSPETNNAQTSDSNGQVENSENNIKSRLHSGSMCEQNTTTTANHQYSHISSEQIHKNFQERLLHAGAANPKFVALVTSFVCLFIYLHFCVLQFPTIEWKSSGILQNARWQNCKCSFCVHVFTHTQKIELLRLCLEEEHNANITFNSYINNS